MPRPKTSLLGPLKSNTFRLPRGQKQVFLPNFTLTLLRTPHASPQYATFLTPLNLNKLDLRDYLYHLYNIRTLSIRSYVQQSRVRQDKPSARMPKRHRWYRPRATKKMTVEMLASEPFVWPEPPTDFGPWDKETSERAEKEREMEQKVMGYEGKRLEKQDGGALRRQAEELLAGRKAWKAGWVDYDVMGQGRRGVGSQLGM
ncbi:MAG: hypothetical protein Q9220_002826 [cf. Caloplaca sp. 1 TL-2023]